ncbi:unnamed protein product [Lampetra fluviatilis]
MRGTGVALVSHPLVWPQQAAFTEAAAAAACYSLTATLPQQSVADDTGREESTVSLGCRYSVLCAIVPKHTFTCRSRSGTRRAETTEGSSRPVTRHGTRAIGHHGQSSESSASSLAPKDVKIHAHTRRARHESMIPAKTPSVSHPPRLLLLRLLIIILIIILLFRLSVPTEVSRIISVGRSGLLSSRRCSLP